jgi:phosphatidylglycerol lysyltransferase
VPTDAVRAKGSGRGAGHHDHEAARALVLRYGWNVASYQVLNRGMRLWFSRAGDAVAGYAAHGKFWVVAGAPICAHERLPAVADELSNDASRSHARVLYFGAGERLERIMGGSERHHLLRLGAQPVWDPAGWPSIVRSKASLRAQINRARNKRVVVRELSHDMSASELHALHAVLDAWLGTRGLPPLHFMTESDTLDELRDRRVFVAERDGRTVAFLVATPVPARGGWLVEQWPRTPDAPNGTTHLLVDAAMRAFEQSQARFVTLGLAPLSDRAGPIGDGESAWLRMLLRWVRAHGRRFYNFRGLDAFKASLEPNRWESIYAIAPGPRVTPGMLAAVAGVFGSGSPVALVSRAIWMGARREARSLIRAARRIQRV